jgi:hypothetical protein
MIMSSVVDPSSFNVSCFKTPGYRNQAESFFRGIWDNGVLVVDGDAYLQDKLIEKIKNLPSKVGQQLLIRITDLLMEKNKKVVRLNNLGLPKKDLLELAYNVKTEGRADGLVLSDRGLARLQGKGAKDPSLIPLSDYSNSEYEARRHHSMDGMRTIDQMPGSEVEKLIGRAIKYSRWLRFYDKQIGKGTNLPGFRRGISLILDIWKKDGYFASRNEVEYIEIISKHSDKQAAKRIKRSLVNPLMRDHGYDIRLSLKRMDKFPHPRYLQTRQGVFLFEAGFDFVETNGTFRTCEMRVSNNNLALLQSVLDSPDVDCGL